MPNLSHNFTAGKMNKVFDERLVPNGEYIDAMNIRMGSTENSEIGVIENTKGNLSLTKLLFPNDGTPLSASARCIGAYEDGANETLYWFVHDPDFSLGFGKLDMIVSFNVYANILTYHVVSIHEASVSPDRTTLNFDPTYLITGINKIGDLLFFTEYNNAPRFINVKRNYPRPDLALFDQFSAESLLVIKKPPVQSPTISLSKNAGDESFMDTRFICFAYRYLYADGEYSAISQFTAPAFDPGQFNFSPDSCLNEGMVNDFNQALVTYNSGGPLVKGIDLLFKESNDNVIKVIEKLNKAELGLVDNQNYSYTFSNSKIFTVLPESELLRLYDNVPRHAMAQTLMGNRLMYLNYIEGYDLIDYMGFPTKLEYVSSLQSNPIGVVAMPNTLGSGNYTFDTPQTITDSVVYIDLTGIDLIAGSAISLDIDFTHSSFSGPTTAPVSTTQNTSLTFSFSLLNDYASVYALSVSQEFQNAVGTVLNIQPVYPIPSTPGNTFTDQFNNSIPVTLSPLEKYASGIDSAQQPIRIISSPSSNSIGFQLPSMRFVSDVTSPSGGCYEYYKITYAEAEYQKLGNEQSLHSNRGYELGIVYMDEFNRATTALVSPNNTVFVPCGSSIDKNEIIATIPVTQVAPEWATRYKFVIKPENEGYEVVYSRLAFIDPLTNNAYLLLEGDNAAKVEQGDRLIVKSDANGPTAACTYVTVLEKEAKPEGFITVPSHNPSINLNIPSGVYMMLNPGSIAIDTGSQNIIAHGTDRTNTLIHGTEYPLLQYPIYGGAIPAGSRIVLNFEFNRPGGGSGNGSCERRTYSLKKTLTASANYNSFKDWWDGDAVKNVLNSGDSHVGGSGNCPIYNLYEPTLAATSSDVVYDECQNYYRFWYDGTDMWLLITGTSRCGFVALSPERRTSYIAASIEIYLAGNVLIFETKAAPALPDVFYENDLSFSINPIGEHAGNIQDQNRSLGLPAIVNTGFFNCFAFGNGAESYKVRDSLIGNWFNLGNRVTAVAAQDYKEANRFADITYSGIYNNESNLNKLNEFNLGLLNFKKLEQSFGPGFVLDGRETDVLVLQEDKISYVLAGKNLLSDAAAGGAITSVPEVLGTQIARTEKYGISFNPESYVQWGYNRYFTDVKRGAVLQLVGNAYTNDRLVVVSENGMRTWFRDEFNRSFNTQKLGGFDPYMNEYVLTTNDILVPNLNDCISCGLSQTFVFTGAEGDTFTYCINAGMLVGEAQVNYNILSHEENSISIQTTYNGTTHDTGWTSESGSFNINKNSNSEYTVTVVVTTNGPMTFEIDVQCPLAQPLTIVEVILTNDNESGQSIHTQYRYTDGAYVSPLQQTPVTFASGSGSPLVSRYQRTTGFIGSGSIPTNGSTVRIATDKIVPDTFDFNASTDRFRYLRSATLYDNNPTDILALINDSTVLVPGGSGNYYYSDFSAGSGSGYLYLIWDFRAQHPITLCYSETDATDVCCNCTPCTNNCMTYSLTNSTDIEAEVQYKTCPGGIIDIATVPPNSSITICSAKDVFPSVVFGSVLIEVTNFCGCAS